MVLAHASALPGEQVALEHVHGRFLAEDVGAAIDLPPFESSAMDGYALRAGDTPGRLALVGESAAGGPYPGALAAGQAVVISTGAVVPAQADAVAPLEDVSRDGEQIVVRTNIAAGAFVRHRGSDIERGERLLSAGTRLGPAQIGAAAAAGLGALACLASRASRRSAPEASCVSRVDASPKARSSTQTLRCSKPRLRRAGRAWSRSWRPRTRARHTVRRSPERSSTTSSSAPAVCRWEPTTSFATSVASSASARSSGASRCGRGSHWRLVCARGRSCSGFQGIRSRVSSAASCLCARRCSRCRAPRACGQRGARVR